MSEGTPEDGEVAVDMGALGRSEETAAQLVQALADMQHLGAFKTVVRIFQRHLGEIDAKNRRRGRENDRTEAQAYQDILAAVATAESRRPSLHIDPTKTM